MTQNKICLVIPSLQCGGAERVISQLANVFSANNLVFLILLSNKEIFYEIDSRVKIIVPEYSKLLNNRYFDVLRLLPFFRNTIKKIQPNTILSFGRVHNPFVILATIGLDVTVYVSDRGNPFYNSGFVNEFLRRILYKRATGIISQTSFSAENVKASIKHLNVKVIPNPIRHIAKVDVIKENRIIFVGRLVKGKGVNYLLEAFSQLQAEGWILDIVGDGPERLNLKLQCEMLKISESVIFHGQVSNVDYYLSRSEIFVFPSLSEGFPNGLVEAMGNGLACISFNCITGPADLINDGVNGFLVEVGDTKSLIQKMKVLVENKELRNSFKSNAILVNEMYNVNKVSELYYNFIINS